MGLANIDTEEKAYIAMTDWMDTDCLDELANLGNPQIYKPNRKKNMKRKIPNFTIQVVENGYLIYYDGEHYVYNKLDDIIDKFVDKLMQKPQIKFE